MLIEREVVDLYRAMLMRDRVGEEFQATITGITEHGIYAALDAPYVDVLCRTSALFPDHYEVDQHGTRLYGLRSGASYALFDRIALRIEDVSIARRKISALPVENAPVEQLPRPRQQQRRTERGRAAKNTRKGREPAERNARRRTKESKRQQRRERKQGSGGQGSRKTKRRR